MNTKTNENYPLLTSTNIINELEDIVNNNKKTIIHLSNIQPNENIQDKKNEALNILNSIGEFLYETNDGIKIIQRNGNEKLYKVADLVNDDPIKRQKIVNYVNNSNKKDDLDLVIGLSMSKEMLTWNFCEQRIAV